MVLRMFRLRQRDYVSKRDRGGLDSRQVRNAWRVFVEEARQKWGYSVFANKDTADGTADGMPVSFALGGQEEQVAGMTALVDHFARSSGLPIDPRAELVEPCFQEDNAHPATSGGI